MGQPGNTHPAHWKDDRERALSINFDDSTPGQANHGVPTFAARGLTGTWFINPGNYAAKYRDVWEVDAPAGGQELASHSMHHDGADNFAEAESEIGDAAALVNSAYPSSRSKLTGFNSGGGTDWLITDQEYQSLLTRYHHIERKHSTGISSATVGADPLTGAAIHAYVSARLQSTTQGWADGWGIIHFHGICNINDLNNQNHCICTAGQPCQEFGEGTLSAGIESSEFSAFADLLVSDSYFADAVWIGGFASVYKYQQLRNQATFRLVSADADSVVVRMSSTLDPTLLSDGTDPQTAAELFDEAITLFTEVPGDWTGCQVTQCGVARSCSVSGGVAMYDAYLGGEDIVLSRN